MTGPTQQQTRLAYGLMLISPALFCSNMIMARAMVGILPPMSMAFLRWGFVAVFLVVCLWPQIRQYWGLIKTEWLSLLCLGGLGMGLCGGPVYLAGEQTTATNIGLIYAASPLLILLISAGFFGHLIGTRQFLGFVMGLCGVIWILIGGEIGRLMQLDFNRGDLWICMSTLAFSLYSIGLKHWPSKLPALLRLAMMAAAGALWHLPFVVMELTLFSRIITPSWPALQGVLVLVFISSLGAYISYGKIVELIGASRAGVVLYIAPLYNAGLALILLGETLSSFHFVGTALILPGIWLANQVMVQPAKR